MIAGSGGQARRGQVTLSWTKEPAGAGFLSARPIAAPEASTDCFLHVAQL